MVDVLVERYKRFIPKIVVDIVPSFNLKINDLIYVAGGESFLKRAHIKYLQEGTLKRNLIYTNGRTFLKGYKFEYSKK
jgi:hypothetical protein